jgi:hypothetical protein
MSIYIINGYKKKVSRIFRDFASLPGEVLKLIQDFLPRENRRASIPSFYA